MTDSAPAIVRPGTVVTAAITQQDFHGTPVAAIVPIKSAWLSKVNWAQGITGGATLLAYFGFDLPSDVQAAILSIITGTGVISTWVLRTWFNGSVSAASISK